MIGQTWSCLYESRSPMHTLDCHSIKSLHYLVYLLLELYIIHTDNIIAGSTRESEISSQKLFQVTRVLKQSWLHVETIAMSHISSYISNINYYSLQWLMGVSLTRMNSCKISNVCQLDRLPSWGYCSGPAMTNHLVQTANILPVWLSGGAVYSTWHVET